MNHINHDMSAYRAFQVLHLGFTIAPIVAGLDKFTNFLTRWEMYLSPVIANMLPCSPETFMRIVGGIEIFAGLLVAFKPKSGGLIVSVWLLAIVINLMMTRGFYDIALRDFGLSLGALALFFLSQSSTAVRQ